MVGILAAITVASCCSCAARAIHVPTPALEARWYLDRNPKDASPCKALLYLGIVNVGDATLVADRVWIEGREQCAEIYGDRDPREKGNDRALLKDPFAPGALRVVYLGEYCQELPTAVIPVVDDKLDYALRTKIPSMPSALPRKPAVEGCDIKRCSRPDPPTRPCPTPVAATYPPK
jgi:hypothetical protein